MAEALRRVDKDEILNRIEEAGGKERQARILDEDMAEPRAVIDELVVDGDLDRLAIGDHIFLKLRG